MSNEIHPIIANRDVTVHILKAFNLHTRKKLGQNFLIDKMIVQGIVSAAELSSDDKVLEIGPGIGTLTQGMAETGADITAVELDKKLPAVLAETLKGYDNIRIIQGDILKVNISEIMGSRPYKVVANLPYYITTPILMTLLERKLPITRIVTMVQKEVAERMTAKPGSKAYGALSAAVQYYTVPSIVLQVPPKSFMPEPEVNSVVISCVVREKPPVDVLDEKLFFRIVRGAFGQRRKTLANALKGAGFQKDEIERSLTLAGIDLKRRGETLSLDEFAAITDAFIKINS